MTVTPPRSPAPNITNIWGPIRARLRDRAGEGLRARPAWTRVEAALAALRAYDAQEPADGSARGAPRAGRRGRLALWLFVVQREALGLRDTRQLMRDYQVPPEVQGRMGAFPGK